MLRTHLTRLAVAVGLVAVAAQAARANIYLDVQYASGGAAGSSAYLANIDSGHETLTLNVYALVTDSAPAASVDMFREIAGGFFVGSSALKGDITFGAFGSNVSGVGVPGTTYTTAFGAIGLGASSAATTTGTAWWTAPSSNSPNYLTNGTLYTPPGAGSAQGVEFLLGTLNLTFSNYALPVTSTTAALAANGPTKTGASTKPFQWADSSGTFSASFGSASNVGNNGSADLLYHSLGAGLNFVLTTSNTGGGVLSPAALTAVLGLSSGSVALGGTTLPLVGNVGNSASNGSDGLNWNSAGPGIFSISPSAGTGLAAGSSTPLTGTVLATSAGFGPWVASVTFTGSGSSGTTGVATGSPVVAPVNFAIIGHGTKGTADGLGVPGGSYGNLMTTQGSVGVGYNLAGLTTTLGSGASSFGIGKTTATILAGTLATSSTGISESWRSRSSNETPAGSVAAGGAPLHLPLYGDVVNLNGISGGTANTYVLQMTYDPNELGGTAAAAGAASNGFLFLGYRSADGVWKNAASTGGTTGDGNTGTGSNASSNVQGSYASFTAGAGSGFSLAQTLGTWGVDTAADTVWAVIDHDAEFAPVPEPGTIALLVGGIAALGYAYRRRKAAKA